MLNESILLAFDGFANSGPVPSSLAIFFAEQFPYTLIFLGAIYAYSLRKKYGLFRAFILILLPPLAAWGLANVFKSFFHEMRPFAALGLTPLVTGENPFASFPSGHATFFAALGMMIFLQKRNIGRWFLIGALVIGIARIAVGIHWPSDILAGFLLGGLVAFIANLLWQKFSKESARSHSS